VTLLLDTHVWIWSQEEPALLHLRARKAIDDRSNNCAVSVISEMEIARLALRNKITLGVSVEEWIQRTITVLGASEIEIGRTIAMEAYRLPGEFHKDPADRILVATARIHGMTLVSADERLLGYRHLNLISARR
jgi:PIN domain nuclease of toxin-antitoxin system